jgi:hypothetical protein
MEAFNIPKNMQMDLINLFLLLLNKDKILAWFSKFQLYKAEAALLIIKCKFNSIISDIKHFSYRSPVKLSNGIINQSQNNIDSQNLRS